MITLAQIAEHIGVNCPIVSINSDGFIEFEGSATQLQKDAANLIIADWLNGVYPQSLLMEEAIKHFEDITTKFIESKVQAYNIANGLAFKNIDAFPKYALNSASQHYAIANQFIVYADNIWKAVRTYQATLTAIPTDEKFQVVLDGVTF